MIGKVKKLLKDKNFGFIVGENRKEYFFHREVFQGDWNELNQEDSVLFEEGEERNNKGPRADVVRLID